MTVRREKVILDLEDRLSGPMGGATAQTIAFQRALKRLDGTSVKTGRSLSDHAVRGIDRTAAAARRGDSDLNRFTGRIRALVDAAILVGPAMIPIAAVGVPALTGLASQAGAAVLGVGTLVAAFQGVGTALSAVNEAALDPTTENLEKAREAMQALGPDARQLVRDLHDARPALLALRDSAAAGGFPGLTNALDRLLTLGPQLEGVLFGIGDAAGDLAAVFADGLAGPRGQQFLEFIRTEVPGALTELGYTVGNLAAGLAELWMAFTPLNRDFSGWLLEASRGFDQWAQGLAQTDGFREFVAYLRANGPRVAEALGAIGNALLQVIQAAAPLGGPVLQTLEAVADVIAAIAGSDVGPAILATVTALTLLSRGMKAFGAVSATSWAQSISGARGLHAQVSMLRRTALRGGGLLAGLGIAASGAAEGIGLSNTASLALMGTLGGPWGAAVGGAVGLMLDLSASSDRFKVNSDDLLSTLDEQTGAITRNTTAWAANQLEKDGVLRAAQQLGLNLEDVTAAALGDADALQRVTADLAAAKAVLFDDRGVPVVGTEELRDFADSSYTVERGIGAVGGALGEAQGKFRRVAEAAGGAADELDRGASAADRFREAVIAANKAISRDQSLIDYQRSLDDLRKTIRENGRTLSRNTEAGRQNREALLGIAQSALEVSENMRKSNRLPFLRQARGDIVDAAVKLGMTREQARALADRLLGLDKIRARPRIDVDAGGSMQILSQVDAWLNRLDGKRATTYVETIRTGARTVPGLQMADGGTVPPPFSGTVPGPRHPYRDSMVALLAGTEEVITNRNGEADQFRRDRAAGRIPAYADGGTAWMHAERAAAPTSGSGSRTRVVERVIERPMQRIVLDAGELGQRVFDIVDGRIEDYRGHDAARAKSQTVGGYSDHG